MTACESRKGSVMAFCHSTHSSRGADSIASFRLMPDVAIPALAVGLPVLEIVTGGMLIGGWLPRAAAFNAMALCSVFALALVSALARGLEVDCGCFGPGEPSGLGWRRDAMPCFSEVWRSTGYAGKVARRLTERPGDGVRS